jgi:hypothetical protein
MRVPVKSVVVGLLEPRRVLVKAERVLVRAMPMRPVVRETTIVKARRESCDIIFSLAFHNFMPHIEIMKFSQNHRSLQSSLRGEPPWLQHGRIHVQPPWLQHGRLHVQPPWLQHGRLHVQHPRLLGESAQLKKGGPPLLQGGFRQLVSTNLF